MFTSSLLRLERVSAIRLMQDYKHSSSSTMVEIATVHTQPIPKPLAQIHPSHKNFLLENYLTITQKRKAEILETKYGNEAIAVTKLCSLFHAPVFLLR